MANDDVKPLTLTEVPASDWKFGFNSTGEYKARIIVTFKDDKNNSWVRMYDKEVKSEVKYFCFGCLNNRRLKNYAELDKDKFYAPKFHDCTKRCAKENEMEQKVFEKIKVKRSVTPFDNEKSSESKVIAKKSSTSSSSIIDLSYTPKKAKPIPASIDRRTSKSSRTNSPIVINSTSTPSPRSNSRKSSIEVFCKPFKRIQTPLEDSSPENTPMKTPQEQIAERKRRLQKRQSLNEKENKNQTVNIITNVKPSEEKQKSACAEDEITVVEPDEHEHNMNFEPYDPDDHPEYFKTSKLRESPASTNDEKAEPSKTVNEDEKIAEKGEVVIDRNAKMLQTKRSVLEDDITLVEPMFAPENSETAARVKNGVPPEVKEAEVTTVFKNEHINSVSPGPSFEPSGASGNDKNHEAKKSTEKLTPAIINQMEKRQLTLGEYEFGVNSRNEMEKRIIVPDEDDENYVREYQKWQRKQWKCCGCELKNSRKIYGILENDIFYAPPKHFCEPQLRKDWEANQRLIKEKYSNSSQQCGESSSVSATGEVEVRVTRRSAAVAEINHVPASSFSTSNVSSRPSTSISTSLTNEFRKVDWWYVTYGINENGEKKAILIVREREPNEHLAREYVVVKGKDWKCVNCSIGIVRKGDDEFLASINHECAPIPYATIQEKQEKYKAKNKNPERSASSLSTENKPRSESQMSKSSFDSSVKKENQTAVTSCSSFTQPASLSTSSSSKLQKLSSDQWEWGYDATGNEKMRIIAYDLKNKEDAYEYRNSGRKIMCLGCHTGGKCLYGAKSDDDIPIISVPPEENHVCKPRSMKEIREQQKKYVNKVKKRQRAYEDSEDEDYGKRTRRSAPFIEQNTVISSNSFGEEDNKNAIHDEFDTPEPFSSMNSSFATPKTETMEEVCDNNVSLPKIQSYSISNDSTTVKFYLPSSADFEKCCVKLQLPYSRAAYKFWSQIDIERIAPTSIPNKIYSVTNAQRTGFACLTLFLTGAETETATIKDVFNKNYFLKNLAEMGKYYGEDLSRTYDEKTIQIILANDLTKYHFQALCQFFECRIGVFVDGKWERYGNWDDEAANVLTFLMKKENKKISPILSLIE